MPARCRIVSIVYSRIPKELIHQEKARNTLNGRWIPIPSQFHSLYHDGLFTQCVDCERDLLDGTCVYWIERIFRGPEPICEMAICTACRERLAGELSRESMMRITAFVEERFDYQMRYEEAQKWPSDEIERWLDHCVITKLPSQECPDYQIAGLCCGDSMSIDLLPFMLSNQAVEAIQKLMSRTTRDRLGDMMQDFFGMPSEFADDPNRCSPMLW